jgi:hypothetical protein
MWCSSERRKCAQRAYPKKTVEVDYLKVFWRVRQAGSAPENGNQY